MPGESQKSAHLEVIKEQLHTFSQEMQERILNAPGLRFKRQLDNHYALKKTRIRSENKFRWLVGASGAIREERKVHRGLHAVWA